VSNVRTALRWTLALVVYGLLAALTHWAHFRTPAPRLALDPAAPGQFVAGLAMAHVQCVPLQFITTLDCHCCHRPASRRSPCNQG